MQDSESRNLHRPFFAYASLHWDYHVRGPAEVSNHGLVQALFVTNIFATNLQSCQSMTPMATRVLERIMNKIQAQNASYEAGNIKTTEHDPSKGPISQRLPSLSRMDYGGTKALNSQSSPRNNLHRHSIVPLYLAVIFRLSRTVSLILQNEFDSQVFTTAISSLLLELSISLGDSETTSALIDAGSSLGWKNPLGAYASSYGHCMFWGSRN